MDKRGRPLIRENEGVSSPKRRKTEVSQGFCDDMSHFCQAHFVAVDFTAIFALARGPWVR